MSTPQPVARRDAANEYRRLVAALASRAGRIGSRDAEAAAQEALKRSLANPVSRAAVEYYFHERSPDRLDAPHWPLDQLLAWLYGVLRFVVREESARVSYRREVPAFDADALDVRDPSPDQLDRLIDSETEAIVHECLASLTEEYRTVLTLRAQGLKYSQIAVQLGVPENTVATWVRRATQTVARHVRERMGYQPCAAVADHQD